MSNSEDFQDTGMTSVFYQGVQSERQRIIQTLTNHLTRNSKRDWNPGLEYCYECGGFEYLLPDLVALIKGETNELLEILADK